MNFRRVESHFKKQEYSYDVLSNLKGDETIIKEKYEAAIRQLSAKQVGQALKKHIDPKRLLIITAGDFSAAKKSDPTPQKKE